MSQPPDDHRAAFRATENPRVAFTAWRVDGAVGILYGRAREMQSSLGPTRPGQRGRPGLVVTIEVRLESRAPPLRRSMVFSHESSARRLGSRRAACVRRAWCGDHFRRRAYRHPLRSDRPEIATLCHVFSLRPNA